MKRKSQQGVALIITLILLSVITFMAIAFLALTRRERGAVGVLTDQTTARNAADTAFERAKAQAIASILATTNRLAYDTLVSTNFINPRGFNPAVGGANFTNVSYVYADGSPVTNPVHLAQVVANLWYDPRPPVFVTTNRFQLTRPEFRYYLDLNRNGRFDTNGSLPVLDNLGRPIRNANGVIITNYFLGDPEWVGIPEFPDLPQSSSNKFVARYAFYLLPLGKMLDLNSIHNQAKRLGQTMNGYFRNQGVGTWELNLAAFLHDSNTNAWPDYRYDPNPLAESRGIAFVDALSLLRYRYGGNFNTLLSAHDYFGGLADVPFGGDFMDDYTGGPLMVGTSALTDDWDKGATLNQPWPGSDNTNHFFTPQELFDPAKTSPAFVKRLLDAGQRTNSYDRYTFFQLTSLIGSDTAPEPPGRLNLNYVNVRGLSATNFIPWTPAEFFTNAADRMLRDPGLAAYPGLSVTNIPIWPTNYYTPAVNRLLQLAANLYDASTNRLGDRYPNLPTVFRPIFGRTLTNIYIAGYEELEGDHRSLLTKTTHDVGDPTERAALQPRDMVYGVPLVIGAKKGFPNFNEVAMESVIQMTRKLQVVKGVRGGPPVQTNQMYVIGISNMFGVEGWNSYRTNYPRKLELIAAVDVTSVLTNEVGLLRSNRVSQGASTNYAANAWPGYSGYGNFSFKMPLVGGYWFVTNSIYQQSPAGGGGLTNISAGFLRNSGFPIPKLWLNLYNRARFILLDTDGPVPRIVDYVNLAGLDNRIDITTELMGNRTVLGEASTMGNQWLTNRVGNSPSPFAATYGVVNQLEVSLGNQTVGLADWNSYSLQAVNGQDKAKSIDAFRVFMGLSPVVYQTNPPVMTNLVMQAPFTPTRKIYQHNTWQANDPLVHSLPGDLTSLDRTNDLNFVNPPNQPAPGLKNLGLLNDRYRPWGGNPNQSVDPDAYNLALKDPLVRRSDDWDFPTNKFPNVGWLGRIHRGTPWQTVYLKSPDVNLNAWAHWTGNPFAHDVIWMKPTNDWALLELFTAAPNDNATRGQLNVNQSAVPAWSAVLSGVLTLTNVVSDRALANVFQPAVFQPAIVQPVGLDTTNSPLQILVDGINRERVRKNANGNFIHPNGTFRQLGEVLSVPELTVASPFLNLSDVQRHKGLSDAVYERIPQQIMGLLRGDDAPRFVVYAYGQTLKPAPNSVVMSGPLFGLCTNYQITAEVATRTVLRLDGAPNNPRPVVESFNTLPPD